ALLKRIAQRECQESPNGGGKIGEWEEKRGTEIIADYRDGADNWRRTGKRVRTEWKKSELYHCLSGELKKGPQWCDDSLFVKLSDPRESAKDRSVLQALINVVRSFSLPDQVHETPKEVQAHEFSYGEARN